MNLAEFAAAAQGLAERAEAELALAAVRPAARELLAAMEIVTPVLSGDLRKSEHIQSVAGSGAQAVALVGPDIIYDKFRNDGGTIESHGSWPLRNKKTGQVFGRKVTQEGAHYMEKAEEEGRPFVDAAIRVAVNEFLHL